MSAIVNGEGGVIINGVSGGGGAGLPTAAGADEIPVSTGAGTSYVAQQAGDVVSTVLQQALGPLAAGSAIVSDGAGDITTTSATVSALLAATTLPFTSVVNAVEHTTNNSSTYHLLTISCAQASRGYTFRGTISATKSDFTNAYSWDVFAAVSHDGAVTLRDVIITPTDPASPYAVTVDVNGANLRVGVIGVAATSVKWHGGGFLTQYGA